MTTTRKQRTLTIYRGISTGTVLWRKRHKVEPRNFIAQPWLARARTTWARYAVVALIGVVPELMVTHVCDAGLRLDDHRGNAIPIDVQIRALKDSSVPGLFSGIGLNELKLSFAGRPQPISSAPQGKREEGNDDGGGGSHKVVPRIDPFCRLFDRSICEAVSKSTAFFGPLLGFFLLFLLTRSKR